MKQEDKLEKRIRVFVNIKKIDLLDNEKIGLYLNTIYGTYHLELNGSKNLSVRLKKGDVLEAKFVLVPSSLTDFIGQKPSKDDVVTSSYEIYSLRIIKGAHIYKRKTT